MSHEQEPRNASSDDDNDDDEEDNTDPESILTRYCACRLAQFKFAHLLELQKIVDVDERARKAHVDAALKSLEMWLQQVLDADNATGNRMEIMESCARAYNLADESIDEFVNRPTPTAADNSQSGNFPVLQQQSDKFLDSIHTTFDTAYDWHRKAASALQSFGRYLGLSSSSSSSSSVNDNSSGLVGVADAASPQDAQSRLVIQFQQQMYEIYLEYVRRARKQRAKEAGGVPGFPSELTLDELVDFIKEAALPPASMDVEVATSSGNGEPPSPLLRHRKIFLSDDGRAIFWPQCYTSYFLYLAHTLRNMDITKQLLDINAQTLSPDIAGDTTNDLETNSHAINDDTKARMHEQQTLSQKRAANFLAAATLSSTGQLSGGGAATRIEARRVVEIADAATGGRTKFENWLLEHAKFFYSVVSESILNRTTLYYDVVAFGPPGPSFAAFDAADARISKRLPRELLRNGYMSGLAEAAHLAYVYRGLIAKFIATFCSPELVVTLERLDDEVTTDRPLDYADLNSVSCPTGDLLQNDVYVKLPDGVDSVEFRFFKAATYAALAPDPTPRAPAPGISDLERSSSSRETRKPHRKQQTATAAAAAVTATTAPNIYSLNPALPGLLSATAMAATKTVNNHHSASEPTNQQVFV